MSTTEIARLSEAERETLDAILVALWQAESEAGYAFGRTKVERAVEQIVREARAKAWDEGAAASGENWAREIWQDGEPIANPYRPTSPASTDGSSS